jgi:hypothetical protein
METNRRAIMTTDATENADIRELNASELDQASGAAAGLILVAIAVMCVATAHYCEPKAGKTAQ